MVTRNFGVEFATAKYNSTGVRQWVDYLFRPDDGQNFPQKISVTPAGDVYVTGSSSNSGDLVSTLLVKYNTSGKQAWSQHVDNFNVMGSANVAVDSQENVYWAVTEVTQDPLTGTANHSFIYKYDPIGNLLSTTPTEGFATNVETDARGNSYVLGASDSVPAESAATIMAEFKADGTSWQVGIPGPGEIAGPANIAPNRDGSVFASQFSGANGLMKFSSTGVPLWTVQNSGLLAVNSFGDVYVAAQTVSKCDPNGNLIWQQPFEGPSHQAATPTAIAAAGGELIVTGMTSINGVPASLTINYVQDGAKLTPLILTFSDQAVGSRSPAQAIVVKNTAEQPLAILKISSASLDFGQTNDCAATLAPGVSCTISVTFAPASTGTFVGSLEVIDPWSGSPQIVKLIGTSTH